MPPLMWQQQVARSGVSSATLRQRRASEYTPPRPRSGLRDQDEETTAVAARNAWTPNSREKAGSPSLPPPFDRSPPTIPISISDMNR